MRLLGHLAGTPGYTLAQTTTTDAHGFYQLTQPSVQANSRFYVRANGAVSASKRVNVEAQVTLNGPTPGSQLLTGPSNRVEFTGSVNPADVGAKVSLQRQDSLTGNGWFLIGSAIVEANGSFKAVHTFVVPGSASIRVLIHSNKHNVPSTSNELAYEILQAQNPQLKITASADPIAYGQSVTVSGVASGADNQPVTLLAHTALQNGFAPVSEVMTNGNGEYTFPAQTPVNNTFYEVKASGGISGGQTSATLYGGVKDLLTAEVAQSMVQAGQALKFSGTVAPDHTGHIVYLERQNASHGGGFHVVQVATVGAGSAYSIMHTVYDVGTKVFRVRIPGGPDNEGVASSPFTVQVTPAPASALTPEAPGNSSLPSEGSESNGEQRTSNEGSPS